MVSRIICITFVLAFSVVHQSRTSGDMMLEVTEEGNGGSGCSLSVTGLPGARYLFGYPIRTFRVAASSTEFSMSIETHTVLSTTPIARKGFKFRFPAVPPPLP